MKSRFYDLQHIKAIPIADYMHGWSRGFGRRSRPWLVNGRDPRLSVGGIAPTGAYRSEVPRPQALKVIVYYKVRKTQRPQIANSAV